MSVEPHVDIAPSGSLWTLVELPDGSFVDLGTHVSNRHGSPPDRVVRINACDLRSTCRQTAALHSEAASCGETIAVLVDLEVLIHHDRTKVRKWMAGLGGSRSSCTLRYVGTPAGLAGLIADIHVLQLADGVALLPLTPLACDLTLNMALPQLATLGVDTVAFPAGREHFSDTARGAKREPTRF